MGITIQQQSMTVQNPALRDSALAKIEEDFDKFTEPTETTFEAQPTTISQDTAIMRRVKTKLDYLAWLSEGPDDYDTIDEVISPTSESRYNYDPYTLWALTITNNAATGGPNLLFRLTDTYGRIKQYKIPPQQNFSLKDMKGLLGNVFNIIASAAPGAEAIVFVSLKWPSYAPSGVLASPAAHQALVLKGAVSP